ncbi:MAG: DNA polymerase III subunit gamma/tau [Deltaproteobacteria bacterium]|nr:DNA polymerase III subunit gamma/tau [Deltaproteobacteria bacterium]
MYQVIALKFRPQLFEDVVGQDHITTVIKNAIDTGRISHAFIFSGPRGVGKTSVARILAKALNCEKGPSTRPCNECSICKDITASRAIDVFEIDAASHTGVDNVREIIENARYAPSVARYKVFIIDEVHMLSKSAFNALLKTIEEPPPHVIFIMATTELNKIPPTVLSRCQRYDFRRIPVGDIVSHLQFVANKEEINITDDAIMTIALQADGSMRDAQGILEHVAATNIKEITLDTIETLLGMVGRSIIHDVLSSIVNRDTLSLLELIDSIYQYGQDLNQLYKSLLEQFRNMMVLKIGYDIKTLPKEEIAFLKEIIKDISFEEIHRALGVLIRSEEDLRHSALPKITLETILLRVIAAPRLVDLSQLIDAISSRRTVAKVESPPAHTTDKFKKPLSSLPKSWDGFMSYIKNHDSPIFAVLSKASSVLEDENKIIISTPTPFLTEQIKKMLPEIKQVTSTFFKKEINIKIEEVKGDLSSQSSLPEQTGANNSPIPSAPPLVNEKLPDLNAEAIQSPIVKEIISQFDGTITDVKAKK